MQNALILIDISTATTLITWMIVSYYQQIGRPSRNIERAYTFLMCGSEDEKIQNYFIETAFPTREEAEAVYNTIRTHAESGLSLYEVLRQVNIPHTRVEKALMFLENMPELPRQGGISRKSGYQLTVESIKIS